MGAIREIQEDKRVLFETAATNKKALVEILVRLYIFIINGGDLNGLRYVIREWSKRKFATSI